MSLGNGDDEKNQFRWNVRCDSKGSVLNKVIFSPKIKSTKHIHLGNSERIITEVWNESHFYELSWLVFIRNGIEWVHTFHCDNLMWFVKSVSVPGVMFWNVSNPEWGYYPFKRCPLFFVPNRTSSEKECNIGSFLLNIFRDVYFCQTH